jgi:hypothetical protein
MERLPAEIVLMIIYECNINIKDIAVFCRCCQGYNRIFTPILYARNIKKGDFSCVLFALKQCFDENAFILILKNAINAKAKLEIQDTPLLPNIFPRHLKGEFFWLSFDTNLVSNEHTGVRYITKP